VTQRRGAAPPRRAVRGWFVAESPDFRRRGLWLLVLFTTMTVVLSLRLADVQLRQHHSLSAAAARQHGIDITLRAHRGRILDRDGSLLAGDVPVYSIFADPGVIPPDQRHTVAEQVAPILNMGPSHLESLISEPGRFVYLARRVDESVTTRLRELKLYGIGIIPEDERVYSPSPLPGVSFASNLLGFVDHDGHGQYGIEAKYEPLLRGEDGIESTLRDVAGNPIVLSNEQRRDARNGSDLRLGIDSKIQYWAEQALAKGVATDSQAESGTIMVMDTHTGAIRAWADYPSYDANHFSQSDIGLFRDSAVDYLYEPGSVMKVVTFAGGLDHHLLTADQTINEQQQTIGGFLIHDWDNRSHGKVTFQWVLDDSLNNGAIEVMRRLGKDAYYQNLLAFGIGSPTGIDVAGEVNQPLRQQRVWTDVDYATASFGQQVQTTPVEMLAAVNAVANGGVWVQPHAVEAIVDPQTGAQTPFVPRTRQVMSPDTAHYLAHMMTGVVEDHGASGFLAKIPGFKGLIGGKTGTASIAVNGAYGADTICSFVGFLPVENPQFTAFVIIRKPHENKTPHEGAYLAAPVWKSVAQIAVDTWKIVP
jgi:stage V sporulation protein D (sporulation-specific penicillin-binding protein)